MEAAAESTRGASGGVTCAADPRFAIRWIGIASVAPVSSDVASFPSLFTRGSGPALSMITGAGAARGSEPDALERDGGRWGSMEPNPSGVFSVMTGGEALGGGWLRVRTAL